MIKIFATLTIIITFIGCKPIDITDPIPVWYRMTLESRTAEFSSGLVGLESAIPLLEAQNVDFSQAIIVKQVTFSIERESLADTTPYILYIGDIMADTVAVSESVNDVYTTNRGYYDINKGCKDPYWRVQSDHNVMVRVRMLIYAFKEN